MQIVKEKCRDIHIGLLIEDVRIEYTIGSDDSYEFVFISFDHDPGDRCTHFEALSSLIILYLLI